MVGILDGIRVVDMTAWWAGPGGTAFLADLGADVIKVEQLGVGDPQRGATHALGVPLSLPGGRQMWVEVANRNKRGIAIDAVKLEGKQIIYDLVTKSDVFASNLRLDSLERLGFSYHQLKKYNDKLIYLHSSGFGAKGPMAGVGSFDIMAMARGGAMSTGTDPDVPEACCSGMADSVSSIMLAFGVVAALLGRERHGIGQMVESSQLGAVIAALHSHLSVTFFSGRDFNGMVREEANNPLWNWYKCQDGKWIAVGCIQYNRHWPLFAEAVGLGHLKDDPRFINGEKAKENHRELVAILDKTFATRPVREWEEILSAADLINTRINKFQDIATDPQVVDNELVTDFDDPVLGKVKVLGQLIKYSATPGRLKSLAPEYGQHTEEVLLEVCGSSCQMLWKFPSSIRVFQAVTPAS